MTLTTNMHWEKVHTIDNSVLYKHGPVLSPTIITTILTVASNHWGNYLSHRAQ
jgi:hypothetical protein